MAPSVDSLFDPSENTWISPEGISGRNSRKSTAAFAFVRPCRVLILLQVSVRVSLIVHGGTWSGLTCSVRERERVGDIRNMYYLSLFVRLIFCGL